MIIKLSCSICEHSREIRFTTCAHYHTDAILLQAAADIQHAATHDTVGETTTLHPFADYTVRMLAETMRRRDDSEIGLRILLDKEKE